MGSNPTFPGGLKLLSGLACGVPREAPTRSLPPHSGNPPGTAEGSLSFTLYTSRSHSLSPIPGEETAGESFRKKSSPHWKLVLDSSFSLGVAGRVGVMQCLPCCSAPGKESACNVGAPVSIPGLGRSPGEGKGYPLQYSGLENSMDCIVHGVAKSQIRLSDFHFLLGARGTSHTQRASAAGSRSHKFSLDHGGGRMDGPVFMPWCRAVRDAWNFSFS